MSAVITPRFIASNMIDVEYPDGSLVLFSYKTPVAAWMKGRPQAFVRSEVKHSATTGRHINTWFRSFGVSNPDPVPQAELDALASCSEKVWALRDAIRELGA